jgi:uncharacterized protein YerC
MIKRHEVQVLLDAGFTHPQVAKQSGVSVRSVARIARESRVVALDGSGATRVRGVGRPSPAGVGP